MAALTNVYQYTSDYRRFSQSHFKKADFFSRLLRERPALLRPASASNCSLHLKVKTAGDEALSALLIRKDVTWHCLERSRSQKVSCHAKRLRRLSTSEVPATYKKIPSFQSKTSQGRASGILSLQSFTASSPRQMASAPDAEGNGVSSQAEPTSKFSFNFPHICPAARTMMVDLLVTLETELGSELLPTQTPEAVRSFKSPIGNAEGSVVLRAGRERSQVDRMLVSSLHCELPFGTLDFATLTVLMGPATDAPHLLFEFPFSGTAKVMAVMDLLPRKDLALHVEYLKRFYENTPLTTIHKQCEEDQRMERYITPSLYLRCATSPTACLYTVDPSKWPSSESQGQSIGALGSSQVNGPDGSTSSTGFFKLDDAVREVVHPKAKEVMLAWIDAVKKHAHAVPVGEERRHMAERDSVLLANGIEWDLTSNLPRLFGQEVTDQVLEAFRRGV